MQGKDVTPDFFLYSCLEHERTSKAKETQGADRIVWPEIEEESLSEEQMSQKLKELIRQMFLWYKGNYQELGFSDPLDHERLNEIVPALVSMNRDIGALYKIKIGEDIPHYDMSFGNNMIWEDVEGEIQNLFPNYAGLINRYIQWSYSANPKEEEFLADRPPVGRYASRHSHDRGGRGGRGGDNRGNHRGGNDRGRGPRNGNRKDFDGGGRGGRGGRGGNDRGNDRGRGGRDGGGGRGRGRDGGGRGRNHNQDGGQLEEAALMDVYKAIKTLNKDGADVSEVTLKPTNSFYRRLQHQKAVEAGFESSSVGEGHDRAVRVVKKA